MRYLLAMLLMSFFSGGFASDNADLFEKVEHLARAGNPEAQYHLGMFYNNGIGTNKDNAKAFEWFKKSAMAGDALGNYKLGCYYAGQGEGVVVSDREKALKYKLVAAQQGYALAQYDVASIYYENNEIEQAVKWLKESANQGDSGSIYALFNLFYKGEKISKDAVLAYGYLKIIERNTGEHQKSAIDEKLRELEKELSAGQLEEAQEFATNWSAQKTPLTVKALSGLEESKRIASDNR